MEARMLLAGIAVATGFACLFMLALSIMATLRRRRVAMAAQGDSLSVSGLLAWRLRNGFAPALSLARFLLRFKHVRETVDEAVITCAEHGFATGREPLLTVALVWTGALALALGLVTGSPIAPFATLTCVGAIAFVLAGNARDKRQESIREAVPEALESMAACLGSGFTLMQTFRQVSEDVRGPLGETFSRSAHTLEMGGSAERALAELRQGAHASELAFVAVALDVQHQSGGAMRQVLDAANDTVKGELALRRTLRVQTAQAKLSARVVVVMPFVLVAAFSLASPDFLMPFFSSVYGYALLALAIIMQVAGILLVRRALAVDGVV